MTTALGLLGCAIAARLRVRTGDGGHGEGGDDDQRAGDEGAHGGETERCTSRFPPGFDQSGAPATGISGTARRSACV